MATIAKDMPAGREVDPDRPAQLKDEFASLLGIPFTPGNKIEVLRNGDEIFPSMLEAIGSANESIEFLTFVYWTGNIAVRFAEALATRARAGVRIRVLLDAVGAREMEDRLVEKMKEAGVEVKWFRPLSWRVWRNVHRSHRKVLVCDRRVGFTGGVGIAAEWEGNAEDEDSWRDTHFRVEGEVVAGLRAAFIGNWIEDGRQWEAAAERAILSEDSGDADIQVVRATSSHGWSDIATLQRSAIMLARHSLDICAAYFVPDDSAVELLTDAVKRGVRVRIITVGEHTDSLMSKMAGDNQIESLLTGGVELYRFLPTMVHAKIIVIDQALAIVGSANFNQRSMRKDDEVCMTVADSVTVETLSLHFEHDLSRSQQLTLENWERRSLWTRFKEAVARLWFGEV